MSAINPMLKEEAAFDEAETRAMAMAFDDVCRALDLPPDANGERQTIAIRIVDLARAGETDPGIVCERIVREAKAISKL